MSRKAIGLGVLFAVALTTAPAFAQSNESIMRWTTQMVDRAEALSGMPGSRYANLNQMTSQFSTNLTRQALVNDRLLTDLYAGCNAGSYVACQRLQQAYANVQAFKNRVDGQSAVMNAQIHNENVRAGMRAQQEARDHYDDLLHQFQMQRW